MLHLIAVFATVLAVCAPFVKSFAGPNESALGSMDKFFGASHLESGEKVLGMVGFFGQPDPVQWLILTDNPKEPQVLRESVFGRGRVLAERKFTPLPGQDLPCLPISRSSLKVDSGVAFRTAEARARELKLSFESAHFQLRVREIGSEPVWMLSLVNVSHVSIGTIYISASSGSILKESWVTVPKEKLLTGTSPDSGSALRP